MPGQQAGKRQKLENPQEAPVIAEGKVVGEKGLFQDFRV